MSLVEIHGRFATTSVLFVGIMILWGLWLFIRRKGVDSNYRGALVVAEILLLVQSALGSFLYLSKSGSLERPGVHILYGVVGVLVIPSIFLFTREDEQRLSTLVYVAVLIFLIGILFRSMVTSA